MCRDFAGILRSSFWMCKGGLMHTGNFKTSRKVMMLMGDIVLISAAYIMATALIFNRSAAVENIFLYNGLLPMLMVITGLLMNVNGLYSIVYKRFAEVLLGLIVTHFCVLILVMSLSYMLKDYTYSRRVLLVALLLQCIFLAVWRFVSWHMGRSILNRRSMLLAGSEAACNHVYNRLRHQPQLNMKLKYVCTELADGSWKAAADKVDIVMICADMSHRDKTDIVNYCYRHGKEIMLIPESFELFCSGARLDKIDDIPVFRLQSLCPSLEVRIMKRTLDILVALAGLVCALPFMAAVAIAIKLGDSGPVLYSQVRTGRHGREFRIYKFRTMRVDAEKDSGPMLAQENDPRITGLGRFLRSVRLDELPQIWNVLNGDMSIVGPRPERPFFVEKFVQEMPEYAYRHNVKPGITGLAQVYGKYNTTPFDKLVYDLMYIQGCSIRTDLTIIIQTVMVLFTKSATEGVQKSEVVGVNRYLYNDLGDKK